MLLNELMKDHMLILASESARRKTLLEGLDLKFEVIVKKNIPEDYPPNLDKFEIPVYLAKHKSGFYTDLLHDKTILITADTIVWHNDTVVGKPVNIQHAKEILSSLSGSMHEVITGVCIRSDKKLKTFYSHSRVVFSKISSEEINYYVEHYQPFDKAGAYGIQEWIGYIGIEKIEGSFYNVMGLPVQMLYRELMNFVEEARS